MIYCVELIRSEDPQTPVCCTALRGSEVMELVEALRRDYPDYLRIEVYFDENRLFVIDPAGQIASNAA